jgi:hypothetical protein
MLVASVAVLSVAFVSPMVETLAVLVVVAAAAADTPTVSVIELRPFTGMTAAVVHVTVEPLAPQVHPVPVPDTKLMPVGRLSVTVTGPYVAPLPVLETVIVYLPFWPTRNDPE